jgi:hypothetical protein
VSAHSSDFKKLGGRYKRIRRGLKGKPSAEVYQAKVEALGELEALAKEHAIDLLYGDEWQVSLLPCIPYGRQFADEEVAMPTARGASLNCFALLTSANECRFVSACFISWVSPDQVRTCP